MSGPTKPANEIYVSYAGQIDQAVVSRFVQAIATATNQSVTHIHLLLQTLGGVVGDGICLYNMFRGLPFDLTIYNAGSVQSIGAIAYLGAKKRKTSAYATFMVHRCISAAQAATALRLKASANSLSIEDEATEAILRKYLTLTQEQWERFEHHGLFLSANEAVDVGLAHEIGDFVPPFGSRLYTI